MYYFRGITAPRFTDRTTITLRGKSVFREGYTGALKPHKTNKWVRSSHVSAYAYVYVAAAFTCAYACACAYALVKTSLNVRIVRLSIC